jgi:hypothetical protein
VLHDPHDRRHVLVVLIDPVGGVEVVPVVHAEHGGVVDQDVDRAERGERALAACSAPASFARVAQAAFAVPPAAVMSATTRSASAARRPCTTTDAPSRASRRTPPRRCRRSNR